MLKKKFLTLMNWIYKNAFYVILTLATAFRLYYYIVNPSFFLDEARTGAYLYKDIDWYFGITWPIGQLWLQQIISSIFGYYEYVLRLTPFLASILNMIVGYKLMNKWFGKNFATIFLALFAFAPLTVQFSIEYKQYSVDLLITALYMLTFTNIIKENVVSNKNFVFLLLLSILGPWLSYPLIFSMVTWTGLYLIFKKFKVNKDNVKIVTAAFLGGISFVFLYILFIKQSTQATGLIDYWNAYYMPLNPIKLLHWIKFITLDISENLLGFRHYFILLGVVLVGIGLLFIILDKKYKEALFFLSPLLLVLIASIFKKYPFGERVLFFLLPSFYLLVTYGVLAFKKLTDVKLIKKFSYLTKYASHL
ncbi:MAG TPA: glycosyltransferase family 39 protein, partial [Candidatus Dojkabacteria bacterium]|nr:glycosyltransferase family 39 protein [Candidatus Dojkabacteria bacterium]